MPPALTELVDSRETPTADRPSATLHYVLEGTGDDATARNTKKILDEQKAGQKFAQRAGMPINKP